MFYFFSKTISYLLTPAGWLILASGLAFFLKNARYRRWLSGAVFTIFWLFGNSFLVNELALWWEYPVQPVSAVPVDSTGQIAILLTGGIINGMKELPAAASSPAARNRFLLGPEADRAGQALYLYKTGAVQKILISGGIGTLPFQPKSISDEGQMTARFLRVAGVKADDIILENKSRNTHENAVFTARILRQRFPSMKYVLVTSAWHIRRAVACFQKAGVTVTPFPGGFISTKRSFLPGEWLLPHEEAFQDAYYLVRELFGYVAYRVNGYV